MRDTVRFIVEEIEAGRGERLLDFTVEQTANGLYSQEKGEALGNTISILMHLRELLIDFDQAK